jgi:hypothetical protein
MGSESEFARSSSADGVPERQTCVISSWHAPPWGLATTTASAYAIDASFCSAIKTPVGNLLAIVRGWGGMEKYH